MSHRGDARGFAGWLAVAVVAGCGSFEDPDIVLDLRVVAITASVPEQVIDVDLRDPAAPSELLRQLVPTEVCVLIADPGADRRLRYELTLCAYGDDARCDPQIQKTLGEGVIDDPDTTALAPRLCAQVLPDGDLLGILLATVDDDRFAGLGGLDYLVSLRIGGEGGDPTLDLYAIKTLRVAPRIPAERQANLNPDLDHLEVSVEQGAAMPLGTGRCVDQLAPLEVGPSQTLRLTPVEPDEARELYAVPTIDGRAQWFTESLTYQWMARAGGFSRGSSGGPRDVFGNVAPLFTDWTSPRAEDLLGITDVPLWIVQRDERLGARWFESCVRVVP